MNLKQLCIATALIGVSSLAVAGVNNCEKQVERYKKLCEKDPGATNMDACFNYKVFNRWCSDPSVTPQNQPAKACGARSAVIREEAAAEKDASLKKMRLQQADQNDTVCKSMPG